MNGVNKTLYIPLYGKSYVSKKGIILKDKKAEEIWETSGFPLKGKSKSKWLAYYMGMRSKIFDNWLKDQMERDKDAVILHIGCGMDSRIERVGTCGHFNRIHILMDCYTVFAAKASKYKNPINEVGVTTVYGIDDPQVLENGTGIAFAEELDLTPSYLVNELSGMEKAIFKKVFAGNFAKKMYRLFEYEG